MSNIRERKHRLPRHEYQGRIEVAFTACLRGGTLSVNDDPLVASLVRQLETYSRAKSCSVPVYCFMPDHLHLILRGLTDDSDTWAAMTAFKLQSGLLLKRSGKGLHWQKDFYDHVIRTGEDARSQARYIAANPCRAALVEYWQEWPYTGSIDESVEDWLL